MNEYRAVFPLVFALTILLVSSCGGGGGSSGSGANIGGIEFKISGASTLLVTKDAISTSALRDSNTGKLASKSPPITNLIVIDSSGNVSVGVSADYPIKISFSVVNPAGAKVYLALSPGWDTENDDNDYTDYIEETNCAIYEVDIVADSQSDGDDFRCVMTGMLVAEDTAGASTSSSTRIEANTKPIQFDRNGAVYFIGQRFDLETWKGTCGGGDESSMTGFIAQYAEDNAPGDGPIDCTQEAYDNGFTWTAWDFEEVFINTNGPPDNLPQGLVKYDPVSQEAAIITTDSEWVGLFTVLNSGEVVVSGSTNLDGGVSNGETEFLDLFTLDGGRIGLFRIGEWYLGGLSADSDNTVVYGTNEDLRIIKPKANGELESSILDFEHVRSNLQLLNYLDDYYDHYNIYAGASPVPMIQADDGNLYGVFETIGGNFSKPENEMSFGFSVFQLLPYNAQPKFQYQLGISSNNPGMPGSSFQIANGYLYYLAEDIQVQFSGTDYDLDHVIMINLETLEQKTLFLPSTENEIRYQINDWRLVGEVIYFSALNQLDNSVLIGQLDTKKVQDGAEASEYLTLTVSESELAATNEIRDIEIIEAQVTKVYPPGNATVNIIADSENHESVSIEFSKPMNKASVLDNLVFKDESTGNPVPYIPFWIGTSLHLIPDISDPVIALSDDTNAPLKANTTYRVTLDASMTDADGGLIDSSTPETLSSTWTTVTDDGWYLADTDASNTSLSSDKVLKYLRTSYNGDLSDLGHNGFDYYKLATDVPVNFRLEFSARNIGTTMPGFIFHESSTTGPGSAYSFSLELQILSEGLFTHLGWDTPADYFGETGKAFINGEWRRFRITVIGTSLIVEFSYDGVNFIQAQNLTVSADIAGDELYIMTGNSFLMDDLSLTTLDGAGQPLTVVDDLLDEDFNTVLGDITDFDLSVKSNDPISNTW